MGSPTPTAYSWRPGANGGWCKALLDENSKDAGNANFHQPGSKSNSELRLPK